MVSSRWLRDQFLRRTRNEQSDLADNVRAVDSYLGEGTRAVFQMLVDNLEKSDAVNRRLSELINPGKTIWDVGEEENQCKIEYPDRFFKRLNQRVLVDGKGDYEKCGRRWLNVYVVEFDDINEMLDHSDYKPSYAFKETLGKDLGRTLIVYSNDEFEIVRYSMDWVARPTMPANPSALADEEYIGPDGKAILDDTNIEFDEYVADAIVDYAVLYSVRDSLEPQNFEMQRAKILKYVTESR
jgi:hypothetical protein